MRVFAVAILALFAVCGDTLWSPQYILKHNESEHTQVTLLWRAAKQGNEVASEQLLEYAKTHNDEFWIRQLLSLERPSAAWELYLRSEEYNVRLLRQAALGGVPDAQLEYGLIEEQGERRRQWLEKAAQQGLVDATVALADWHLLRGDTETAQQWLLKVADDNASSAYQLGRLLWEQGAHQEGVHWFEVAKSLDSELAQRFLYLINTFKLNDLTLRDFVNPAQGDPCLQRVGLVATSLAAVDNAEKIYHTFITDERLSGLPICLSAPVWVDKTKVPCDNPARSNGRLICDIRRLADTVEQGELTHLIVIADEGVANVNNGVMFLDIGDDYDVFVHELAHFAGFVDEYPMSSGLAQYYCDTGDAPNLITLGQLTYQPYQRAIEWQDLPTFAGIWRSRTCQNANIQSFKPTRQLTFMEHHDTGAIPPLYIHLWRMQLANPATRVPVSVTLSRQFGENSALGQYWSNVTDRLRHPD